MNKRSMRSGQVGIIAVLVGVVIFTLGMAVAGRVVTDIRLSSRSEEGARANVAAESAMEIALSHTVQTLADIAAGTSTTPTTWTDGQLVDADFEVTAMPGPSDDIYELGPMQEGETRTVWLVHLADDANSNPFTAAPYLQDFQITWQGINTKIEVALYYKSSTSSEEVSVWRKFETTNNFVHIDPADPSLIPPDFVQYFLVRIKAIRGNPTEVTVFPDPDTGVFPVQEFSIVANGSTKDGQVRRRTTGSRRVGDIPAFFDYVLAVGDGNLVK